MKNRISTLFLIAVVTMMIGCTTDTIISPELIDEPVIQDELTGEEQMLLAEMGIAPGKTGISFTRARVYTFENPEGPSVGGSLLVRQNSRILLALRSELEPGTAVTLWLVIFNAPWNCTDNECGEDDFTNPDARVDIVYADGRVILPPSQRRSLRDHYFFARHDVGETSGSIVPLLFGTEALGLEDASMAEVHFVLHSHGPVIDGMEEAMTSTFNGGCEGFPPELGTPGPNTCTSIQFAIHRPQGVLQDELAQVRRATALYQNVSLAENAGYGDIELCVPGQGCHFLNGGLLDDTFDLEKPEILIYAPNPQGNHLRLVAVEYAVPFDAESPTPPKGFTGDQDVWEHNVEFGLWVLHTWIWQGNPNGVFADTNPHVP